MNGRLLYGLIPPPARKSMDFARSPKILGMTKLPNLRPLHMAQRTLDQAQRDELMSVPHQHTTCACHADDG
jgi:hypothetical protein